MLEFKGKQSRFCDGGRRSFLRAGTMAFGGMSLGTLLKARAAQAAAGKPGKKTSVILVWLGGGPSHLDMYDMKPEAPVEIRGEFNPIPSSLTGQFVSEHLPYTSKQIHKCSLLRSVTHGDADHASAAHYLLTGYEPTKVSTFNEMPSYGSIAAKACGPRKPGVPAYVAVPEPPGGGMAAYLGAAYNPFAVGGDPNSPGYQVRDIAKNSSLTFERLQDRSALRAQLDSLRKEVDNSGLMEGLDVFHQQAFEMVSNATAQQAFDLSRESSRTRDAYGRTSFGQSLLLARRLVEAGVTFVTVKNNGWDTHNYNFRTLRDEKLPELDRPFAALIEDMHARGLLEETLVIQMGEFGRSWFVTQQTMGREHWPKCYSVLLAGGGLKMGQVIGTSDSRGAFPIDRPITPEDLLATMYKVLGIDTQTEYLNAALRPFKILNSGKPIRELFS